MLSIAYRDQARKFSDTLLRAKRWSDDPLLEQLVDIEIGAYALATAAALQINRTCPPYSVSRDHRIRIWMYLETRARKNRLIVYAIEYSKNSGTTWLNPMELIQRLKS